MHVFQASWFETLVVKKFKYKHQLQLRGDWRQYEFKTRTSFSNGFSACLIWLCPIPRFGPPKEKGPLVWLDMDQAELDATYAEGEDYRSRSS